MMLRLLLLSIFLPLGQLSAQGTAADYERAAAMRGDLQKLVTRDRIQERWQDGKLYYRVGTGEGQEEFVRVDPADGKRVVIAKADMPPAPAQEERRDRRRGPRGGGGGVSQGTQSPDGKWQAFLKNNNVWLKQTESGEEQQLSNDGTAEDSFRFPLTWSPDSKWLACLREKPPQAHPVNMVESSPKDQVQPRLKTIDYLKPGDRIAQAKPVVFEVTERKARVFSATEADIPNPWSIDDLRWSPDSQRLTFQYNQRGHQVFRLMEISVAEEGKVRTIAAETPATFVDYTNKIFARHLDATRELIWMSERDGWNHLYLYDEATGTVKNQITKGQWVVRRVVGEDEKTRQLWFMAGGVVPEQDPYYEQLCRVNFDGTGLVILTQGEGTHEPASFSPDRQYFVDRWSRVDSPPVHELRRMTDGSLVCELEHASADALLAKGWKFPQRFAAKGRDGQTDIYGVIYRPSNFEAAKKYPVIEEIYAGPHGYFVPKSFGLQQRQQSMAELGFIVVQMDGMGTNWRSKAFHDMCWKNLGDSGFPDRIAWMKAAAEKEPAMDLTRVGLYGGSAGGQSCLRGLLMHGDFYKAGVADCGCHDNRMDKIWWNEQWMGLVGPHYAEQSNVTQAHRLTGKLMLTVGENDTNVDPASTMQVVNALIKADKDFDLVVFPGSNHGAGESSYGQRRRMDFFVKNLLGVEPRR